MGVFVRELTLRTAADGTADVDLHARGRVLAIELEQGTLDAETGVMFVTDEPAGIVILGLNPLGGDARYYPAVPLSSPEGGTELEEHTQPVIAGRIHVAVSAGGDTATGTLRVVLDR